MPRLAFGGQDFQVVGGAALFWPARKALLVADLHLEKASWFAMRGQMLPPQDSLATLDRLEAAIAACGAREIWCLGDNFHDRDGHGRMTQPARARLKGLTQRHAWHWITGNHDAELPAGVGGTVLDEARLEGLVLRHEAKAAETQPELSGHYHPKYRARARARSVSRPCFLACPTKLILPAFGAFTGGLWVDDPALVAVAGPDAVALVATGDRLLRFPVGR